MINHSETYEIRFIPKENILSIMPLLTQLNQDVEPKVLKERVLEMVTQNYKCVGIYDNENLIGICGLWFMTRHYSGRSIEPDHVMIDQKYQSKGLGKQLFNWIFDYARRNNMEAVELNTYVRNTRSHKFYYNNGVEILGYHFVNKLNMT